MRKALAGLPLVLACALTGSHVAPAEEEPPPDRLLLYQDILDESNIRQLVDLAKGECDRQNWEKALGFYEQLQARYGDTLCPSDADRRLYQRLDDRVRREILSLPPEVLARYRLRLDPEVRRLLDQALRDADPAPAALALARYGVSSLGRRAAELLGDLRQERGEFGAAAAAWEAAVQDPALGGEVTPTALAKLALARACQGRVSEALAMASRMAPATRLRIGAASLEPSGWGAWLETLAPRGADPTQAAWPEMGGSSERLSVSERIPWIEKALGWKLAPPLFSPPRLEQFQGMWQEVPRLPGRFHAAAADGLFAISNGETLYLVDARPVEEGRPGAILGKQPLQPSRTAPGQMDWTGALRPFAVTIADGMAIANLVSRKAVAPPVGARGRFGGMPLQTSRCELLAVDLATGKLRWQFPPPTPDASPDASQFDMRTAPVACGDTLVAACTRQANSFEVWLVGLGLSDGKLRWKRFLCASPASQDLDLPVEPALASDGRLVYCLSQRGAVLAVEAETGRASWAYRYAEAPPPPEAPGPRRRAARPFNAQAASPRPFSPPIVKGGVVYALPADADRLLALDAHSGKRRWQRQFKDADQLIGLVEDRLVLTGPTVKGYVVGIQAESREASFNIPDGGAVGRGLVTPDAILIPTAKGVVSIDLSTLKLTGSLLTWPPDFSPKAPRDDIRSPRPRDPRQSPVQEGMNLVAAEGWFCAVGSRGVLAYPIPRPRETGLLEELKANPRDPAVWLRMARHHRAKQEPEKALEDLREGWRLVQETHAREGEQILGLLTVALRQQAAKLRQGGDPAAGAALLQEALLLPQAPSDEADLRLETARALADARQGAAALVQLDAILDRFPNTMVEKAGTFRAADAARQEIGALLEADPALREARTAAARAQFAAAGQDPEKLQALVSRHAESPVAEEALLALARLRLASDRPEGIRLLSACAIRSPGSAPALSALETLLAVAESDGDAAWQTALLEEMSAQYARNGVPLPPRFVALCERRRPRADAWASDPFPLVESWHASGNEQTGLLSVPGNGLSAWSRAVLLSTGQMLDADTGKLVWQSDDSAAAKGWMGVTYDPGTSTVSMVHPGTQAERAGMQVGDRILALNDLPAEGRLQEVIDTLRPGQTVAVKVQRDDKVQILDLQLARRPADGGDGRFRWAVPQGPLILLGSGSEVCAYDIVARGLAWRLPLEAEPQPEEPGQLPANPLSGTAWSQVGGRFSFTALAGRCIVRDAQGGLQGIDILKGERLWSHEVQDFGEEVVPVDEREVACFSGVRDQEACAASLHLIDRVTGRSRLTVPLPPGIPSAPPLLLPGRALVVALPGQIRCLSLQNGKPLWEAPLDGQDAAGTLLSTGTRLLAAGGSQAAAYDPVSGQRAWQMSLSGLQVAGTAVSEGTLYLTLHGEKGGAVLAVATETGQVRWKQALGQEASCPNPVVVGRFLVVDAGRDPDVPGQAGGNLVLFLDQATGKRVGSLVIPWNRGRLHAIHRCGVSILLETSSALYCYKPKAP